MALFFSSTDVLSLVEVNEREKYFAKPVCRDGLTIPRKALEVKIYHLSHYIDRNA